MEAQEPSAGSELLGGVPAGVPADVPGAPLGDTLEGLPGALLRVAPEDEPPEGASLDNA